MAVDRSKFSRRALRLGSLCDIHTLATDALAGGAAVEKLCGCGVELRV